MLAEIVAQKIRQNFADNYRKYHNFVRSHSGLYGKTPAEASGIDIGLGKNRVKDLIKETTEQKNFVIQLGKKRVEKVSIVNGIFKYCW